MKQKTGAKADQVLTHPTSAAESISASGSTPEPMDCLAVGHVGLRGAAAQAALPEWQSDACTQGVYSSEVFEHMARTFWASTWSDLKGVVGDSRSLIQKDVMREEPETPDAVRVFAIKQARVLCQESGVENLGELLLRAAAADGVNEDVLDSPTRRGNTWAEDFGYCMAMEIMGDGVSWSDDHERFEHAEINAEYTSIHASEIIADQATEKLKAYVASLRGEGRTILDGVSLSAVEDLLAPGAVLAEGGETKDRLDEDDPTAEYVFLDEGLGIFEALDLEKIERYSVLDWMPFRAAIMEGMAEADPALGCRVYVLEKSPDGDGTVLRLKLRMDAVRLVSGEFRNDTVARLPIEVDDWSAMDKVVNEALQTAGALGNVKVDLEVEWANGEVTPWTMIADRSSLYQDVRRNFEQSIESLLSKTAADYGSLMTDEILSQAQAENRQFLLTHHLGF